MSHARRSPVNAGLVSPEGRANRSPHPAAILATAWVIGLVAVAAVRLRAGWEPYKALHQWCADNGIPDWVRNLDSLILLGAAALAGAALVARWCGGSAATRLGLQRGRAPWAPMILIALFPMVGGGLVLGLVRWMPAPTLTGLFPKFVGGVIRAPIAEELLFRGLLVGACAAAIGWRGTRFWGNAAAAALLFAATHVPWTVQGIASGWPALLLTGAGGLWYAWLLARWQSLFVPISLHAGMNLGWLLAGATGGAGGGGWIENLLRLATIAIATWWTVRRTTAPTNPNLNEPNEPDEPDEPEAQARAIPRA